MRTYTPLLKFEIPEKTQTVYKLMRLYKRHPGGLFPLYARPGEGDPQAFIVGTWFAAECQRPRLGSKFLAFRPGIHAVSLPYFDQGKEDAKGETRVWVEALMPAYSAATQREANKDRNGITHRLIDPREAYNYKTNANASKAGGWPIAGSMMVTRVLTPEQVNEIRTCAG